MFTRHALRGRPLMRNRTGSGLRHPCLIAAARDASTGIYGLPFRILMVAVNTVLMGIEVRSVPWHPTYSSRERARMQPHIAVIMGTRPLPVESMTSIGVPADIPVRYFQ